MTPSKVTHVAASHALLNDLRGRGWSVQYGTTVSTATHPAGDFRLWLRATGAQSFYTTGPTGSSESESLPSPRYRKPLPFSDLRVVAMPDVIEYLDAMQDTERRQQENAERRVARLESQGVKRPPSSNTRLMRHYLHGTK
jgi:hypothetical protein